MAGLAEKIIRILDLVLTEATFALVADLRRSELLLNSERFFIAGFANPISRLLLMLFATEITKVHLDRPLEYVHRTSCVYLIYIKNKLTKTTRWEGENNLLETSCARQDCWALACIKIISCSLHYGWG
jgi:hypothetical protein